MTPWQRVIFNYNEAEGSGTLMGVFYLALLLMWLLEEHREYRTRVIYPTLLLLAFMLNPLLMKYLWIPMFYGETEFYTVSRMYAFIPVLFVAAYFFTDLLLRQKDRRRLAGAAVGMALLVVLTSSSVFEDKDLKLPENKYGVPQEVVEISERIFLDMEEAKVVAPGELEDSFRQYSSAIRVYNERAGEEGSYEVKQEMEQQWPDIEKLAGIASEHGVDILIFDTDYHGFSSSPADYGYDFYDNIGHYDLYRRTEKAT